MLPHDASMEADVILVGAGLANGLIAARLAATRPDLALTILERSDVPFGTHTWSFHGGDVAVESLRWLAPLIAHGWEGQDVHFPDYSRTLRAPYYSLTSDSLRAALARAPSVRVIAGADVTALAADGVTLAGGRRMRAPCVLDGRGFAPSAHLVLAFQKFVGAEVTVEGGHGLVRPVIMDARVSQRDGFRFIYLLPFDARRVLVEDTRYSDGPALDVEGTLQAIRDYVDRRGWHGAALRLHEQGVLPIALAGDYEAYWRDLPDGPVPVGMRAGLFHPTTGYSLPLAVRIAELVAAERVPESRALGLKVRSAALRIAREQGFFRFLNRMLFRGAEPDGRRRVMQRFYTLSEPLIERFYEGRLRTADQLRLIVGRPPISVGRALGCISEERELRGAGA